MNTHVELDDFAAWLSTAKRGERLVYATRDYRARYDPITPEDRPFATVLWRARQAMHAGDVHLFQKRVTPLHPAVGVHDLIAQRR